MISNITKSMIHLMLFKRNRHRKQLYLLSLILLFVFIVLKISSPSVASQSYHDPLVYDANLELVDPKQVKSLLIDNSVDLNAIDIAILFVHGDSSYLLQDNLRIALTSLLQHSTIAVKFHIVTDTRSYRVAESILNKILVEEKNVQHNVQAVHISTSTLGILETDAPEAEITKLLQKFFTSKTDIYYSDPLFFFSLFSHKIFPGLSRIILIDIDIRFGADIKELYGHFENFTTDNVMAMAYENSVVYRHALSTYRKSRPYTKHGGSPTEGAFPGYNSGVMLIDINRLRDSEVIASYQTESYLSFKSAEYSFTGSLGDQDLYTLIALDHSHLFHTLPCEWNKQYCDWWRGKGYDDVYDQYFECPKPIKIFHGNCKSKIPDAED